MIKINKILIIKYGELSLKKKNKNFFIKTLKNNISKKLEEIKPEITYDFGRMYISVLEDNLETAINKLKEVAGIYEIIEGYLDKDRNIDNIKKNILNLLPGKSFKTFRVSTKRSDKNYPIHSIDVNKIVAGEVLKNIKDISVNLNNPDLNINIEIRFNEILYYFDGYKGMGGYPVGTLGKGLLMLSGGIDSPVAGYLTIKKGVKIETIYFDSPPHTSEMAKNKVIDLAKVLAKYNGEVKLHIINFTNIQEEILKNIPKEYLITIMRRMMYRISDIISKRGKCHIIVNGESIGQVASQTLTSMKVIGCVTKLPTIRPLACFDKMEIIDIAKKINSYDISIRPYEDCCTIFVPDHPVINPLIDKCEEYEKLIPYEDLIFKAINNHEVIKIDENYQNNDYNDIL